MLEAEHLVRCCILTILFQVRLCWTTDGGGACSTVTTCLNVILLPSCPCKGPKCGHPDDWVYWNLWDFNPTVYDTVAFNDHIYHWQHLTALAGIMIPS
ncbi:hypothetical protein BGW80DRAFT_1307537 [Lactifluus volemus]|nr:hypothetical protein BGW80DRAFT_1307537 [Lactifluus volemus]